MKPRSATLAALAICALSLSACDSMGSCRPLVQAFSVNSGPAKTRLVPTVAPRLSSGRCALDVPFAVEPFRGGGGCSLGGGISDAPFKTALNSSSSSSSSPSKKVDTGAIAKYALAAVIQMSLFAGLFKLMDIGIASAGIDPASISALPVALLFYGCALRSRVFNPLNNQRPSRAKAMQGEGSAGFKDRVMPSWTPPGFFFPIMWLLIIGPIRAYTSAIIFQETGTFCNIAILSFMFHLTCGDIWNTINNTEKRYGTSVVGILFVVGSVFHAAWRYYEVLPFAGKLLGATAIWICTAALLIVETWRLNPGPDGEREPLYPVAGKAETKFSWF